MAAKLIVAVVVIPLHRCVFDCPVHSLDLSIGPRMVWLGESVFDTVCLADQIETHLAGCDAVAIAGLLSELGSIVGENCVDLVGYCLKQVLQDLPSCLAIGFLYELGHRELAGSVNRDKEIELAFLGPDLCDVDMEITNGAALERLPLGLVAFDVRQPRSAMPLQTTMQRRARQVRDRWLQSIEAVLRYKRSPGPFASRLNSSGSRVCRLNATTIASSSSLRMVERGSFGPVF